MLDVFPQKRQRKHNCRHVKLVEHKAPDLMEDYCFNVDINLNSGLKRKQTDDMIVDDKVDMVLGQNKTKIDLCLLSGNVMDCRGGSW